MVELKLPDNLVVVARKSDGKRAEGPKAAPKGPEVVLFYPFDEPGETILDRSPAARHGTAHGTTSVPNGRRGGARFFDGNKDFIEVPAARLLDTYREEWRNVGRDPSVGGRSSAWRQDTHGRND